MKEIRFLLLALLLIAIPQSLWAYTKDQIVTFDNMTYKVLVATGNNPTLMFLGTTKMGALVIPDKINDNQGTTFTVTEVGGDTRYSCKDVTSVKLPETIAKLGDVCFYGAKLTEINIPKNVAEISHTAWAGLDAVPECKVEAANTHFDSDDNGLLYTEGKVELRSVPSNIATKTGSSTYTVNSAVTSIAKGAFFSNPGLKKVILPANLQEVEEGWPSIAATKDLEEFVMTPSSTAKYEVKDGVLFTKGLNKLVLYPHAKNVAEYTVPAGVKEMASYGIASNGNMTSIDLNEVTKVDVSALVDVGKLTRIKLPKDLKKDGLRQGAFERCNALEAYEVAEGNTDFSAVGGVLFSENKEILYFYPLAKPDETYTIPSTVKEIAAKAFQGATKLTSLIIPTSVEKIQEQAFLQNYKLASVTFCEPSKITNLSAYSFWQCTKLTEVTLHSSITEIGKVFLLCENLETVNVPANAKLKTIKEDAFATNKKLKNFNFLGNCNLEAIKSNAFANAESLESFNFPKTVTEIGRNAFTGCTSMATATFAEDADIQIIGAGAFADCGLTSISIPKKVKTIEREAFRNCKALNNYKEKWTKKVYDKDTDTDKTSQFNFTSQIDYQIKDVKINHKYGTFAREFDVDLNIYSKEKNTARIGAFVAKLGEVKPGNGDYGTSTYHIRMSSVDVNGVGNGNFGYVPAYTGVLLKALDSETTPSDFYYAIGEDDAQDYKITNNIMHGITVNPRNVGAATTDEVIYVMQGGIFKKAMSNSISLPIHKAYAKIEGVPAGSKVEFSFSDDNTTNAIVTIDAEEKNADNAYYNLNGQRVTSPQRGVFIKGGRKVIIK